MSDPAIDINGLNAEQKLDLLERLWESLRATPERIPLTDAQREELGRRLDEVDAGDTEGIPWDEVVRRIREGEG